MGSGIAVSSLLSGYNVLIKEIDNDSLNFSLNRILGFLFFLTIKINIKGI
jgi:3-hydroxyacyl-CoA dehydrogenase